MINYPTSLDTLTNPASNNTLDSPSHSGQHSDVNDAVEALEAKVGANSSAVTTSHDYKLSGVTGTDKAVSKTGAETLTNKTLTTPIIPSIYQDAGKTKLMTLPDTASDTLVTLAATQALTNKTIGTSNLISFNAPDGFLINGKIVPSVTSNNLTLAIKGLNGNDPSATNPVYIRIGDTIRSITSALSVTKNAGTNWFNAGSSELATKEIDYFAYLGYNATDGVVIGFSRIPYATEYSQFSTTSTDEKYCAISTITNATAGDDYVVIGRFAATLSAGTGYTWSVPTFNSVNLIQRPIFETRVLSWQPVLSGNGSMTITLDHTNTASYWVSDRRFSVISHLDFTVGGTPNTTVTCTMPFKSAYYTSFAISISDVSCVGSGEMVPNSTALNIVKHDISNWTAGVYRYIFPAFTNVIY